MQYEHDENEKDGASNSSVLEGEKRDGSYFEKELDVITKDSLTVRMRHGTEIEIGTQGHYFYDYLLEAHRNLDVGSIVTLTFSGSGFPPLILRLQPEQLQSLELHQSKKIVFTK